jgi:pimeloyl-ACP methyl ester carboxylesterase
MRICYRTRGEPTAEPLLLITGLGQQLNSWPDDFCDALAARGHFVVLFDNRDVGRSSRAACPAPAAADALEALAKGAVHPGGHGG